jgi:hypothetical protein
MWCGANNCGKTAQESVAVLGHIGRLAFHSRSYIGIQQDAIITRIGAGYATLAARPYEKQVASGQRQLSSNPQMVSV